MHLPLLRKLSWDSSAQTADTPYDSALLARSAAYLFAAGATIALVLFLALPRPEADTTGMLATIAASYALAAMALVGFDRISMRLFPWFMACGTLAITAGIYFRGVAMPAHAFFYLWVVFFSFYLFKRRIAVAELAFVTACYGAVLMVQGPPHASHAETWLISVGTFAVAGILIATIRERIDRLVARLADAARTDVLTGLLNRRGFEELFDLELERARRSGRLLSVLVGDLDRFKEINDRFGHQTGDIALERASAILKRRKRRIDTAARMGGEEFALIVPDTDEHRAYMLAERLRTAIRSGFAEEPVPLTISFGIASFEIHGETPEALLAAADEALYAAKELGRDRSVIYSSEIEDILAAAGHRSRRDEHLSTVLALAETIDIRDEGTARHSQTVGRYAEMAARELGLPAETVERVRIAGILHDVGKIGISDAILCKPGPLSPEERVEMRKHPEIGARILRNARLGDLGEWVLTHHERPDGRGFPQGTTSDEIPLAARVLAVADAYEAMTSDRVYRAAIGHEAAQAELARCAGTQFDERVVDAFLRSFRREGASVYPLIGKKR